MNERMIKEIQLLKTCYPDIICNESANWFLITDYQIQEIPGWNLTTFNLSFQVPVGYPGTVPYGIYVPSILKFNNELPNNFIEKATNIPPFNGNWGMFSWTPFEGIWIPTVDLVTGVNLLNFVKSFKDRFLEGK